MEDIAPELYNEIEKKFTAAVQSDSRIKNVVNKLKSGRGTQADMRAVSERLGKHASDAMKEVLVVDRLPDGKLYWNIAERTIKPVLEQVHQTVNTLATLEQRTVDLKHHVNVAVKMGRDPAEHIRTVMGFATNSVSQEELSNALGEPVRTTALDFLDDFQNVNAEERANVGVRQMVIREYDGVGLRSGACNWCLERAGTWDYQDAKDNGVFERHPGCGCTIEVVYADDLEGEGDYGSVPF